MAKTEKITIKDIRKLRDEVRSYDRDWANQIAELMGKEGETIDRQGVWNITNGIISSPNRIRVFVKCAKAHLEKVKGEEQDTINILKA